MEVEMEETYQKRSARRCDKIARLLNIYGKRSSPAEDVPSRPNLAPRRLHNRIDRTVEIVLREVATDRGLVACATSP